MGKNIDKTFIQSKMLNESKGPAVHSLRAQADKAGLQPRDGVKNPGKYGPFDHRRRKFRSFWWRTGKIGGVKTFSGEAISGAKASNCYCRNLLKSQVYLWGYVNNPTEPNGLQAANHLTDSLKAKLRIEMFRFKTGTPA